MARDLEFIVFAHARSGSTTLCNALQLNPQLRILIEPFNETFTQWRPGAKNYRELVKDTESLDLYLDEMFVDHNGVKALDYQMPRSIYAHMVSNPDRRVVFLKRANILQSVVSVLISEQTGVWHSWDLKDPVEERYRDLEPLSIADIRKRIGDLKREMGFYDGVISARPPEATLELTYEDLYLHGVEQRQQLLEETFAFLGVAPPPREETEKLMDPGRTKLNSDSTYLRLPNASEIQQAVGNDETGWLLDRASADSD
ncbi:MAG: hypothetical protein WD646_02400 [Actinomycetota bacterium]